jgi:hypothetical protein
VRIGTDREIKSLVNLFVQNNLVSLICLSGDPAQLEVEMHRRFILLLGIFLGSYVPMAARPPLPQTFRWVEPLTPIVKIAQTVPTGLFLSSSVLLESTGRVAHVNYRFAGVYERRNSLGSLSLVREVETLFIRQSILPLLQVWGGRLRIDGFTSTLNMQNVQLGPAAGGGLLDYRPRRQNCPGGPRSVDLYGVNLTFHFRQDAQLASPTQIWRTLAQIIRAVR